MKIALMSDSHDQWDHLETAIQQANDAGCELLLFAGDLIAPPGVAVLEKFIGEVRVVWGNNEAEKMGLIKKIEATENVELCGDIYEDTVDGVRIFMNHYPRITELAAKSGEFDLCVFGHTHEYHEEKVGDCLLINPGEIQGYVTGEVSWVVFETQTNGCKRNLILI